MTYLTLMNILLTLKLKIYKFFLQFYGIMASKIPVLPKFVPPTHFRLNPRAQISNLLENTPIIHQNDDHDSIASKNLG